MAMTTGEGLPKPSVANVNDLQKVLHSDFLERLETFPSDSVEAIDKGLRLVLSL